MANSVLETLRQDIEDVDGVVKDIVSRHLGQLRHPSWKFPNCDAYQLDIAQQLQKYQIVNEDDEFLVIQTALLELLIDRFCLLLHALSSYADERSLMPRQQSGRDSRLNSASIGYATRQYWGKLNELVSSVNDLKRELSTKDDKIRQLVAAAPKAEASKQKAVADKQPERPEFKVQKPDIAMETSIKGTQTLETAFRPCESCAIIQEALRSIVECLAALVVNQQVPSSVAKFKKCYEGVAWLSANDLMRFIPELNCDLDKIQRQWSWLFSQIDPLRLEVESLTKELESVRQELACKKTELRTINATHENVMNKMETKWQAVDKDAQARIAELRQKNEKLLKDKEHLLDEVQTLRSAVDEKQQLLIDFQRLQSNLDGLSTESQVINQHLVQVTSERDSLRSALQSTKEELNRCTMQIESMRSRCEGLQAKQDSLLEQMSLMDRSSDDFRIKISNLEGQLDATREHLEEKRRELEQLKADKVKLEIELDQLKRFPPRPQLTENCRQKSKEDEAVAQLQKQLVSLQEELSEYKHKEMLLLAFPDPNGPLPFAEPTGDICSDLEKQISATELRSKLLQGQAAQLGKSLKKLREAKSEPQRPSKTEQGNRGFDQEFARSQERPPSASSNGSKLFSKRSSTFLVKPPADVSNEDLVQDAESFESSSDNATKQKLHELNRMTNDISAFSKPMTGQQFQQPIQLWRVNASIPQKEDSDAVSAALTAYIKQKDGLPPSRSRSNSYGKPDPMHEEALRQARVKHDATLALPQLPSLPTCAAATSKVPTSTAPNSVVSRAATRQMAMAAELRLKNRIGSAGKQRQNSVPNQPPPSPFAPDHANYVESVQNAKIGLNWDIFQCSNCSKTFSEKRDLDIHNTYCNTD